MAAFEFCIIDPEVGGCGGELALTYTLIADLAALDLSDDDRSRFLSQAASSAEPYCPECAQILYEERESE